MFVHSLNSSEGRMVRDFKWGQCCKQLKSADMLSSSGLIQPLNLPTNRAVKAGSVRRWDGIQNLTLCVQYFKGNGFFVVNGGVSGGNIGSFTFEESISTHSVFFQF